MVQSVSPDNPGPSFELEDAAHVIVCGRDFGGPAPDGYPEDGRLRYEFGDELPYDYGEKAIEKHPRTLVAIDEDGNVVYGGEDIGTVSGPPDVEGAIQQWESDGFDPSVYDGE